MIKLDFLASRALALLTLALAAPAPASAQGGPCSGANPCGNCLSTIVKDGVRAPGRPPATTNVLVDKFDPALGTLVKVEYTVQIEIASGTEMFENQNPNASCQLQGWQFQSFFQAQDPLGNDMYPTQQVVDCSGSPPPPGILAPYDPSDGPFNGPDSFRGSCPPAPPILSQVVCQDAPAVLGNFQGPGQVAFPFTSNSFSGQQTTCSNLAAVYALNAGYRATVTYYFCPAPPTANPDSAATCPGQPVDIDVLGNDSSAPGQGIDCGSIVITSQPAQGMVAIGAGCTGAAPCPTCRLTYTPPANFSGQVSFRYTVNDACGQTSNEATVTVTVRQPPTVQPKSGETCQGAAVTLTNFLAGATDPDGTVNCSSIALVTQPTLGTAVFQGCSGNAPCANCRLVYTPAAGVCGVDTFSYRVFDATGCPSAPATITITIHCLPSVPDLARTICQNETLTIANFLAGASDPDGTIDCSSLTFPSGPAHGTVAQANCGGSAPCASCTVTYTPTANFTGQDSFTYRVRDTDGCLSNVGTVRVTVRAAPVGMPDSAFTCRPNPVDIFVLANDSDPDGTIDCASLAIATPPANGTAVVTGCAGPAPCPSCRITYTPNAGTCGNDSFTYRVADTDGCLSQPITVTVRVGRGPIGEPDFRAVCQNECITIAVLGNDSDFCPGGIDPATVAIVTPPACGSATPMADGTIQYCAGAGCSTPQTFQYRVADVDGCFSDPINVVINVRPSPVAADDAVEIDGDAPVVIDVLANDSPGTGCELANCGGPCVYDPACPTLLGQPRKGTAVVNADCTVTYTPGARFDGTDRFCYEIRNSCGCTDTACVTVSECIELNRRRPGSLLLYPEFDNRQQALTLITISNLDCSPSGDSVDVEFVFIDGSSCLETNRTFTLTSCDTLTFLTSAFNPQQSRGYLYAFAKNATPSPNNPGGTPIVFNWLIGNELLLNGLDTFEYSINPVSFRAHGREGAPNDDDGDGIRDLNGASSSLPEYDEVPDQILIPRFLGQDLGAPGSDIYNSSIVLVALSGGGSFDTLLDVVGFNDSEEPLSAQYLFRCWDKPLLRTFAPFTLEVLLDSLLSNDPAEIVGAETRESGWMRIDGLTANSSAEEIVDPAFYAVLVERFAQRSAADLPFELCAQQNGDLLPVGPLGDGPNPVAGDNQ